MTAKLWWEKCRPEIVDMYEKYVYGKVPKQCAESDVDGRAIDHEMIGFQLVIVMT